MARKTDCEEKDRLYDIAEKKLFDWMREENRKLNSPYGQFAKCKEGAKKAEGEYLKALDELLKHRGSDDCQF